MEKADRRSKKSQEAIKKALVELMSEKHFNQITIQNISDRANVSRKTIYLHYLDKFDLLDKLTEEHISKLRELQLASSELSFIEGGQIWFEYLEHNYMFFATMLASQATPSFRNRFLEFVIDGLRDEINIDSEKNLGISESVILRFTAAAYVEIVEWWFKNEMPYPPRRMAEQVGLLIERLVE